MLAAIPEAGVLAGAWEETAFQAQLAAGVAGVFMSGAATSRTSEWRSSVTSNDEIVPLLDCPEGAAALNTLTPIERWLFKRSIRRQFNRPKLMAERLPKYGLTGTVHFSSSATFRGYALMMTMFVVLRSRSSSQEPRRSCACLRRSPYGGVASGGQAPHLVWARSGGPVSPDPNQRTIQADAQRGCDALNGQVPAGPVVFRAPTTDHGHKRPDR